MWRPLQIILTAISVFAILFWVNEPILTRIILVIATIFIIGFLDICFAKEKQD